MAVRVALLEQTAKATETSLGEIKTDLRGIRADFRTDIGTLRAEATANRTEIMTHVREWRGKQERDFRVLFGALIVATLGLAGLLARGFHWF